jgi:hypothetical protein
MSMYASGSGMIPMPYRKRFEGWLGRPAVSLADVNKVLSRNVQLVPAIHTEQAVDLDVLLQVLLLSMIFQESSQAL